MGPRTAVIGGGSWVFSLPHDHLDELLDLQGFGWEPYRETAEGLSIAATCTLAELSAMPDGGLGRAPALPPVLHGAPGLVQDLERRDRRRQHLPRAAGRRR